jgi:hypothetical protein
MEPTLSFALLIPSHSLISSKARRRDSALVTLKCTIRSQASHLHFKILGRHRIAQMKENRSIVSATYAPLVCLSESCLLL